MLADHVIEEIKAKHIAWLTPFGIERVKRFRQLFVADLEAALCEAMIADYLSQNVESVEPYEDMSTGGTDYVCMNRGKRFYVEVTCVKIASVVKASWGEAKGTGIIMMTAGQMPELQMAGPDLFTALCALRRTNRTKLFRCRVIANISI
jgi:hypothetical protein